MFDQLIRSNLSTLIGGIEPDLIGLLPTLLEVDMPSTWIRPGLEIRQAGCRRAAAQNEAQTPCDPKSLHTYLLQAEHEELPCERAGTWLMLVSRIPFTPSP